MQPFRIEIRPAPKRTTSGRRQWAWHVIDAANGKREGWSGEHNINRAHVARMVEKLFDAEARGIEVRIVEK